MQDRADADFVIYKPWFITLFGRRIGFEYSRVGLGETPYLDRYILYILGPTLRLHKFWRGDDDRAPHDHPWVFWTFPLRSYVETVEYCCEGEYGPHVPEETCMVTSRCINGINEQFAWAKYPGWQDTIIRRDNIVPAFRISKRPAKYRHIVRGRADGSDKPFWTFVVSGSVTNKWGFWPKAWKFVPWREWRQYVKENL